MQLEGYQLIPAELVFVACLYAQFLNVTQKICLIKIFMKCCAQKMNKYIEKS